MYEKHRFFQTKFYQILLAPAKIINQNFLPPRIGEVKIISSYKDEAKKLENSSKVWDLDEKCDVAFKGSLLLNSSYHGMF